MIRKQTTDTVLMVRPARFGFNEETAVTNHFQVRSDQQVDVAMEALAEFDHYVDLLRKNGVEVIVVQDTLEPATPDSIFPNNWFSTHCTGELVFYPMFADNRQLERKLEAVDMLSLMPGVTKIIDLTKWEADMKALEGTGSMILDRVNKVLFACRSPRTDEEILAEFCKELDYEYILFDSTDDEGRPIYHTNVMMCIAPKQVIICMDSIKSEKEQQTLRACFRSAGREIVEITQEQVKSFAGNMLALHNKSGAPLLVMSKAAYDSLTPDQIKRLSNKSKLITPNLNVIEKNGGGSARCMIAEIFLAHNKKIAEEELILIFE
ncbi:arginine deiminase-related protein [Porphyromonadaceae bacterium W3.11]|nr:arginine deiminase-related protein [Porphyromonadaceae bacterium W3.11]